MKSHWEPVSFGIFLQSNGLAMLHRLGVLADVLARVGVTPHLVEVKSHWEPVSSGILLQSNGLAMLHRLGVLADILAGGFAFHDEMAVLTWRGDPITKVRYPRMAGPTVPATVGISDRYSTMSSPKPRTRQGSAFGWVCPWRH